MAGFDDGSGGHDQSGGIQDLMGARLTRKSPLLEETWRYWSSLRRGHALPRRDALEPRAMSFILGHSMILDRIRPGTVRVRLGGRAVQDLMGMEVRGLPVRAFFDLDARTEATAIVEAVFETPSVLEMDLVSDGPEGRLAGRMLVLPLLDHAGRPTKALTCLSLDGPVQGPPRRFRLMGHRLSPIHAAAAPAPLPVPRQDAPALPLELAEAPAAFRSSPVPWLRVVK